MAAQQIVSIQATIAETMIRWHNLPLNSPLTAQGMVENDNSTYLYVHPSVQASRAAVETGRRVAAAASLMSSASP